MKEALFYEKLDQKKVRCVLCPRFCVIPESGVGYCGVRENKGGILYSLIYNVISSIANDPIEKKPLRSFHPGTTVMSVGTYGCNMRCGHCQNWEISRVNLKIDRVAEEHLTPEELISLAKEKGSAGVAWTYNEPSIWFEYSLEGARLAKENGLYTVWVTNGYVNTGPLDMIGPYLDAFRVDIKGFSNVTYRKLAGVSDFAPILEATARAKKKWNMHVECVTNIIPTVNDDEKQLKDIASWIAEELGAGTDWHITRFFPCFEYAHLQPTPLKTLERAKEIGLEAGLRLVHIGNV